MSLSILYSAIYCQVTEMESVKLEYLSTWLRGKKKKQQQYFFKIFYIAQPMYCSIFLEGFEWNLNVAFQFLQSHWILRVKRGLPNQFPPCPCQLKNLSISLANC